MVDEVYMKLCFEWNDCSGVLFDEMITILIGDQ